MIDESTQLLSVAGIKKRTGIESLSLITNIKYGTDLVKAFNNMTFLYDPNWEYEAGNPTYPISFFYVKSITESMNSDISAKPMLFYNTASDTKGGTYAGFMNVVADNIVIKPKTYKLDILIPANSTTMANISVPNPASVTASNEAMYSTQLSMAQSNIDTTIQQVLSSVMNITKALIKGLYGTALSATAICNALLQQQDYNKASIEYMWRNRRILGLKSWNSWKFKYLVIQNFEVTKVGENGNFYEGTLMCQEVPILTFRNQEKTSLGFMSTVSSFLGTAQKTVVKTFVDTMTTTLGE